MLRYFNGISSLNSCLIGSIFYRDQELEQGMEKVVSDVDLLYLKLKSLSQPEG